MASKIKLNNNQGDTITLEHSDTISSLGNRVIPLDNITHKVSTIAELRAMTERPEFVYVTGYHTADDGAFGSHFFKRSLVVVADNGGTVIQSVYDTYELQYSGAVNVKWFGAKGDGVTDDTVAIQSAVSLPLLYNRQQSIYFPSGTYKVSQKITLGINTTYYGDGEQATVLVSSFTGDWAFMQIVTGSAPIRSKFRNMGFDATATTGGTFSHQGTYGMCEFTNCEFSHSSTGTSGIALDLRTTINMLDNCIITCATGSGKYGLKLSAQYNMVTNCWIDEVNGTSIWITQYYNSFTNCHIQDATTRLVLFESTSRDNTFTNCLLVNGTLYAPTGTITRNYGTENGFNGCTIITNNASYTILESSTTTGRGLYFRACQMDIATYDNAGKGGNISFSNTLTADNLHKLYFASAEPYVNSLILGYQSGTNLGRIYNGYGAVIYHNNSDEWTLNKMRSDDAASGYLLRGTTGVKFATGTGSPEGVVSGYPGSTYSRTDGGSGTCFYVKESGSGNTGWVAK